MSRGIRVGDYVKVVKYGWVYSLYEEWAEQHNLKRFCVGKTPSIGKNSIFKVKGVGSHSYHSSSTTLVGISNKEGDFIWDIKGLQLVHPVMKDLLLLVSEDN